MTSGLLHEQPNPANFETAGKKMQTRTLGKSGIELTTVGLGTWAIGGGDWKFGWGPQDDREAMDAIIRAVELGVNWIDTAAVYGDGQSERLVGRALQELGDLPRPFVATKCSRIVQKDGSVTGDLSRASIHREAEASLKRLAVDTLDLYQVHWPKPPEDIEEAWGAMADLVQQGKARHIGVSNFNVEQMQKLQPIHPIASLQPPYSMVMRDVEDGILEFCAAQGIGVISYSPMYKGLLTGAFDAKRMTKLGDGDHRLQDPNFLSPKFEQHLALVEGLQPIAARNGRTLAELSIAWVLRRTEITSAIVGARRPGQIEATAPASDWRLTKTDEAEIAALLA